MDSVMFGLSLTAAVGAVGAVITGIAAWRYAWRGAKRETERRDIVWKSSRTDEGFVFTHESDLTASDVLAVVAVAGETSTARADSVQRDERLDVTSREAQSIAQRAAEDDARYERDLAAHEERTHTVTPSWMPRGGISIPPIPQIAFPVEVKAVIVWRYPSGASDRQELAWRQSF